jgi:glycerol-3-phosphate acyltransferase PlsY
VTAAYFIFLVFAFLLGSVPTGLILGKMAGRGDVRKVGSGNIGATNVMRAYGKKMGCLTLGLDVFKGFLPVAFVVFLGNRVLGLMINNSVAPSVVALAVALGHIYSPWLRFRGGKGVATALGAALGFSPFSALPSLALFLTTVTATRYVSLGSVMGALALPLYWLYRMTYHPRSDMPWVVLVWSLLAAVVILRHSGNIRRLVNGKERKIGVNNKEQ